MPTSRWSSLKLSRHRNCPMAPNIVARNIPENKAQQSAWGQTTQVGAGQCGDAIHPSLFLDNWRQKAWCSTFYPICPAVVLKNRGGHLLLGRPSGIRRAPTGHPDGPLGGTSGCHRATCKGKKPSQQHLRRPTTKWSRRALTVGNDCRLRAMSENRHSTSCWIWLEARWPSHRGWSV
jgi:hypothetical protein